MTDPLLDRVDAYLDAVQRDSADVETVGPFTLFVSRAPYPLYARPQHGATVEVTGGDLTLLAARCEQVGMPLAVEWVEDVTPSMAAAATAAGLALERYPLLVLRAADFTPAVAPEGVTVEVVRTAAGIALARAVAHTAFGDSGTAVGAAGTAERDSAAGAADPDHLAFFVDEAAAGRTITLAVRAGADGLVASGSIKPVGGTAEIMGVATLPAFRRRGFGAVLTSALVAAALAVGVDLILLSADGDDVARGYERIGFTRIGHAGQAERAD